MTAREKERRQTGGAEKFQWCPTNDWACATLNRLAHFRHMQANRLEEVPIV